MVNAESFIELDSFIEACNSLKKRKLSTKIYRINGKPPFIFIYINVL